MRLTMFISGLALTLSLGLAALAAPVDVDPVPSKHQQFDRSPNLEWALERRTEEAKKSKKLSVIPEEHSSPSIIVTMVAPPPTDLTETEITATEIDKIVENVKHLLAQASEKLGVPQSVKIQVRSQALIKHVPKPNVKLLFKAEVRGASKDVCGGICRGSIMSDSSHGWITTGNVPNPEPIYGSL